MNKKDLESLVDIRISEAQALLNSGNFQGAYYLVGYSLECAIKACIAKQVQQYDFPNKKLAITSHTHKLTELLGVADLKQKLSEKEKNDHAFKLNWIIAKDWTEASRYKCIIEKNEAIDLFNAINEPQSGILIWLKKFW